MRTLLSSETSHNKNFGPGKRSNARRTTDMQEAMMQQQNVERDQRTAELIGAIVGKRFPMLDEYRANVAKVQAEKASRDRAYQDDMRRG